MENNQVKTSSQNETNVLKETKILEVNLSNDFESLYAVATPVKMTE
jgi:hypothetical protein